ncbi:hypothetical protein BAUCODRAFT_118202 [Baudoinia panamericana UAMH 10762]|uniref:Uncharacterized protein n=1 Tax=Baudoinia panamericana (strain UAMH 10762) TaxID=717646 RepID=M2NLQ8_BAUPA|nr:uncharacterized protein BAUCODRAFT_118202 [Baudoinia panamericana UAMH 10762]EMD00430.1 hypothetical protein BAUCODRAFT_118202 [Baudoinia panamericana UAMH 10762]
MDNSMAAVIHGAIGRCSVSDSQRRPLNDSSNLSGSMSEAQGGNPSLHSCLRCPG